MPRLPVVPPPACDESPASWLARLARPYGLNAWDMVLRLTNADEKPCRRQRWSDIDRPSPPIWREIKAWAGEGVATTMADRAAALGIDGSIRLSLYNPFGWRRFERWICPLCWHEGIARLWWRNAFASSCPVHGVRLIELSRSCLGCRRAYRVFPRARSDHGLDCGVCGSPGLREPPALPASPTARALEASLSRTNGVVILGDAGAFPAAVVTAVLTALAVVGPWSQVDPEDTARHPLSRGVCVSDLRRWIEPDPRAMGRFAERLARELDPPPSLTGAPGLDLHGRNSLLGWLFQSTEQRLRAFLRALSPARRAVLSHLLHPLDLTGTPLAPLAKKRRQKRLYRAPNCRKTVYEIHDSSVLSQRNVADLTL